MLLALLLGLCCIATTAEHQAHHRRHREQEREAWLRSSGSFAKDGKGLVRRHEAQAMEAYAYLILGTVD